MAAHRQSQEAANVHSIDQCPVIAVMSNLNVQPCTLVFNLSMILMNFFLVAKRKNFPWPPRPNRQRDGQFGSAESDASAWPDRRYRTGGVASSMNETTS
jgi:hypothetical protein